LAWSVICASQVVDEDAGEVVCIDSDSIEMLDIGSSYGATSTYKRPLYLAGDESSMRDVVNDYFRKNEECDSIVLLYPTVPFRTPQTLRRAIGVFDTCAATSLMSVHEGRNRPFGGLRILDGKFRQILDNAPAFYRRQDTPPVYYADGCIYIIKRAGVQAINNQLYCQETRPFIVDGVEALDIDEEHDFTVAEALVKSGTVKAPRVNRSRR